MPYAQHSLTFQLPFRFGSSRQSRSLARVPSLPLFTIIEHVPPVMLYAPQLKVLPQLLALKLFQIPPASFADRHAASVLCHMH